jgi:hypothetical protein
MTKLRMNQKRGDAKALVHRMFLAAFIAVAGCTVSPSEGVVRDVVIRYFEARHYRVITLDIGRIEAISIGEKTYMGTRGYTVEVKSITLETAGDSVVPSRSGGGRRLTFKEASIRMREDPGRQGGWIIVNVTGIPVV